ncbi:MAG: hypothetical protein AAF065_04495 [Verrucomicrobiota bacterium]
MKKYNKHTFWMLLSLGIWIGLVLGISFMEAPLKFQAPGITTELGLSIGRLVFAALNKMELSCLIVLSIAGAPLLKSWGRWYFITFAGLWALMLGQSFYLLPILDERAALIIAGAPPPDTWHHLGYVILEGIKIPMLLVLFTLAYRKQARTS